jgi:hypothetical protein
MNYGNDHCHIDSRNISYFIEPAGSLPFSQKPTTEPHPEPDESSTQPQELYGDTWFYTLNDKILGRVNGKS